MGSQLLGQVFRVDPVLGKKARCRQQDKVRSGIRNFLNNRLRENELEKIYQSLNDNGRAGMILQIQKYELEYRRLELEMEKSIFERMSDHDIDRVCQWLDARHKQNQIEVTVTTHEQE